MVGRSIYRRTQAATFHLAIRAIADPQSAHLVTADLPRGVPTSLSLERISWPTIRSLVRSSKECFGNS